MSANFPFFIDELLMQDLIESSGEAQKSYLPRLRHRRDADSADDDKKCNNKPKKKSVNIFKRINDFRLISRRVNRFP